MHIINVVLIVVLIISGAFLLLNLGARVGVGHLRDTERGRVYEEVKVFRFRSKKDEEWKYFSHPDLDLVEPRKHFFANEEGKFFEIIQIK